MEAEPSAAGRLLTTGGGSLSREVVVSDADQVDLNASLVLDPEARPGERSFDRSAMAPSVVFKERWRHKEERIRRDSPVGHLEGWRLVPVIVKSNDDLRQEQCASQLIALMHRILHASDKCGSGLRPYEIIAMSPDSGLIEAIPDTVSLHALRSREFGYDSLLAFFEQYFGPPDSPAFLRAQDHFVKSLADYSIACYLLQIKDRHNGNMLLTTHGHIVHIDFGFLLGAFMIC
jgi:phosphatidylinositol 4-kinase